MRQRCMELFRFQIFTIERAEAQRNWIKQTFKTRFGYPRASGILFPCGRWQAGFRIPILEQFQAQDFCELFGKRFATSLAAAKGSPLAAQVSSIFKFAAVAVANQHANILEVAAFAHSIADRASADIETENEAGQERGG